MKLFFCILLITIYHISFAQNTIHFNCDTTFIIYQDTTAHLAFPDVVKIKTGQFLLVYREGSDHYKTGKLIKQFGSKNGLEWTKPVILYDDTLFDDRDPSVTCLKNGKILVNFFKYVRSKKDTLPSVHHNYVIFSNDNGKNFSQAIQINKGEMNLKKAFIIDSLFWVDENNNAINVEGTSHRIIEHQKQLIMASYGGNPMVLSGKNVKSAASKISLFTSTDEGKKWTQKYINKIFWKDVWLQEPALLKLDENNFIIHVRTAKETPFRKGNMAYSSSSDACNTWSEWKYFPFIGHSPFLIKLENNIILSAFRMLNNEYTSQSTAFIYSADNAKTWTEPIIVEDCGKTECGYPSIAEIAKNKILFVYYGNNGHAIKAKIFSIESENR